MSHVEENGKRTKERDKSYKYTSGYAMTFILVIGNSFVSEIQVQTRLKIPVTAYSHVATKTPVTQSMCKTLVVSLLFQAHMQHVSLLELHLGVALPFL